MHSICLLGRGNPLSGCPSWAFAGGRTGAGLAVPPPGERKKLGKTPREKRPESNLLVTPVPHYNVRWKGQRSGFTLQYIDLYIILFFYPCSVFLSFSWILWPNKQKIPFMATTYYVTCSFFFCNIKYLQSFTSKHLKKNNFFSIFVFFSSVCTTHEKSISPVLGYNVHKCA